MKITKIDVGVAQYLMRQAFEEGYLAASGKRGASNANPVKGKWFDEWLGSTTRAMLVENGVISGTEEWR